MTDKSTADSQAHTALPADDVEEVQGSLQDLDPYTLAQRRANLKAMLENSLARYDSVMSRRLPSLAPGVKVRIVRGQLMHQSAVVKEADYIAERALVQPTHGPAQWVRFGVLGPA